MPVFSAGPVVFRVSHPIKPGETALLFGDSIGKDIVVEGRRAGDAGILRRLQVLQASDTSCKVVIPAEWKNGLFELHLRGADKPVYLNRTEVWWFLADAGHTAHPGGELRVFGKNLGAATTAWLESGGHRVALKTTQADPYAVRFLVPTTAAPGEYQLRVSNGFGGAAGVSDAVAVVLKPADVWPATQYPVTSFGAVGDGVHDDTDAFREALAKAATAGGGVVYIPGGRYKITGKLVVPEKTIVRGEKREAVWLFVPRETPQMDAVFAGSRDFVIEELSLVSQTALHLITAPDVPAMYKGLRGNVPPKGLAAANVRLHRLRLQHLVFAHRVNKGDPRREVADGPATVTLAGEDLELSDSEVISAGMPIAVHGSHRLRLERNRLDTGRQGWYGIWDSSETVLEGNTIEGRDLEASYGGFQNRSDRIYYAGNRLQDGYGDEREALTFDTPYTPKWMGRIGETGVVTFTTREYEGAEKRWTPDELAGSVVLIAYGKGVGEYLPIVGNTETTITLERPWDVAPDSTSHVVIRSSRTQIVITKNHFTDASAAVQLYAQSFGIILDGNQAERTGGMYGLAWDFFWEVKKTRRYSTCLFNQWLNNDLGEGFIYQQGAWLNGMLGPAAAPNNGHLTPPAEAVLGNVIRNNHLSDHNTLGALLTGKHPFAMTDFGTLGYLGRDTIIEGNTVVDSPVGIEVYSGYRDTVVRNNKVERCPVPLSDDGENTWSDREDPASVWTRAVAAAKGSTVDSQVAAALIGLHGERRGKSLRLRTEPWAPVVTANGVELRPGVIVDLPDTQELELRLKATAIRIHATF